MAELTTDDGSVPSPSPQEETDSVKIPEEAVEAVWRHLSIPAELGLTLDEAEGLLQAAYPALRASILQEVREGLLSDEPLRAFDKDFIERVWAEDGMPSLPDYRRGMEAALDSIGGGD